MDLAYKTILLKLSGEALGGENGMGIDNQVMTHYVNEIKLAVELGCRLAIVMGGGNIYRGSKEAETGIERVQGDYMGMLSTLINSLALQSKLESVGVPTRLMSAIRIDRVAEYFIRRRALRHLDKGRALIFGAGTGNPYFSTDTAASLRAIEINADILLKATNVDGIYTADPKKDSQAKRIDKISFLECIEKDYRVMDMTAFSLCKENKLPIFIFNARDKNALRNIIMGKSHSGTMVS